jgi:hypothetical protein
MSDDGLETHRTDEQELLGRALLDADIMVRKLLLSPEADPSDGQWRQYFLERVAAYRRCRHHLVAGGRRADVAPEVTAKGELGAHRAARALGEQHRRMLHLLDEESVSAAALTAQAQGYIACVADARRHGLRVHLSPMPGSIEVSVDTG